MKPLTSGDIELNLNGESILSVGSTMLLKCLYGQQDFYSYGSSILCKKVL